MSNASLPKSFGPQIRALREDKGMLLRQVAADLELDQAVLSKLENGLLLPNDQWIEKFGKYYKVSADELRALAYADRIFKDYGAYEHIDKVIKLVRERVASYQTKQNKGGKS